MFSLYSEALEVSEFVKIIESEAREYSISRKKKGAKYYELACAFDIETSSWYEIGEKRACMYIWQFGINGHVCIGRTWQEFMKLYRAICDALSLCESLRLVCYCHNLSYEFQWIRKRFEWLKVFAIRSRTPVYAVTAEGLEFRCSYILSGYSLAKLGEQLQTYPVRKLSGQEFNYDLIRNSKTKLTEYELAYCVTDVLVVMAYIQECIEFEGSIIKIPITKTGYVRRYCRNACFYPEGRSRKSFARLEYTRMLKAMPLLPEEYEELKRAFAGGYTHASAYCSGKVMHDVTSYDFTSSYPYVIVSEQFPMSRGEHIRITSRDQFIFLIKHYACMFNAEFLNIEDTFIWDHYISASRCWIKEHATLDNGRIVKADRIKMTITEQDFLIIAKTYKWDELRISSFYRYERGYLPTSLIKSVLHLYKDKTALKGIPGKEQEYMHAKEQINSCYGAMVTDICRPEYLYENNRWMPEEVPDLEKAINEYNGGYGRFLHYPWGIWVTAAARRNLWTGILEFEHDYCYSDTDSIKVLNAAEHAEYIQRYNARVMEKLHRACDHHGIDISLTSPRTIKGEEKPLGVWSFDGHYSEFKTLGAKRYMVRYSEDPRNGRDAGKLSITVSGLNKRVTVPYIESMKDDSFEVFNDGLVVPAAYTGKSTHTYIDTGTRGSVTDYQGNTCRYSEKSSIHMEAAEYTLSLAQEYIDFILELEDMD